MEWLQPLHTQLPTGQPMTAAGTAGMLLQELGGKHGEHALTPAEWWTLVGVCVVLVCFAGLVSGLTLGLMSLDAVEMEVLKRSGTESEKRAAARIIPIIANEHFLLVTLLLCNALAAEVGGCGGRRVCGLPACRIQSLRLSCVGWLVLSDFRCSGCSRLMT
jgi:hypothetical protein